MMQGLSVDDAATEVHCALEGGRQLLSGHVLTMNILRSQMQQAHLLVRGEGRIATEGVFTQIADRIDVLVARLMRRIALYGDKVAQRPAAGGAAPVLLAYPLGVADEHAHAFAVSCALAVVAQAARDGADSAHAMGDPGNESLLHEIARRVDADIWVVQQSLSTPMDG